MNKIERVLKKYNFYKEGMIIQKFGNGNINKTYLIKEGDWFILQQINKKVFKKPEDVIYNINKINNFVEEKQLDLMIIKLIKNKKNKYITKYKNEYYRCYEYIDCPYVYNIPQNKAMMNEAGKLIGKFLKTFQEFDVSCLKIVIPDFHNTLKRYDYFIKVLNLDKFNRLNCVLKEVGFLIKEKEIIDNFFEKIKNNNIPLRVCHNDTKLSNILFDENKKAKVLIDMDTVMPGYLLFDFADAIRTGISTELEDSKKIENIDINVEYYKEFVNGFLENILPMISYDEISMLVDAVKVITYECALRFMTDYLNGDQYFKIDYDEHNLIRSKNQIMLLKKIIQKEQDLKNIVNECVKNIWKKASF